MTALVASTYPDEDAANRAVTAVVQASKAAVETWLHDPATADRHAFRAVLPFPAGTLLRVGDDSPQTVSSAVAVLQKAPTAAGEPGVTILTTHPVPTPAWELLRPETVPGLVNVCPYPALEQLGLVWLGQDWDGDGAPDAAAVLRAWAAATPATDKDRAADEALTLVRDMDEVGDATLMGLLVDLGFGVPEAGTDPTGLLRAVMQAARG